MEIWKDIEGYEGLYQVSNEGRVKSVRRNVILTPSSNGIGYLHVVLSIDGKQKTFYVHRLVAEAFIPNLDNLPEINHKDENKANNSTENLEWCHHKYNSNYGTRKFGIKPKKVYQFTLDGLLVNVWDSTHECGRHEYKQQGVSACCRGILKQYKGFKWSYNTSVAPIAGA